MTGKNHDRYWSTVHQGMIMKSFLLVTGVLEHKLCTHDQLPVCWQFKESASLKGKLYIYIYIYMYIYIYICMYIYTHTHTHTFF